MIEQVHRSRAISRLWELCKAWGGELKFVTEEQHEQLFEADHALARGWHDSPFIDYHGVNFEEKRVYVVPKRACVGAIIHEMGHVFATEQEPGPADEYPWLGWEICLARLVGAYRPWSEQNAHYGISDHGIADWGTATPAQRKMLIRDRVKHGQRIGIIDANEVPLAIR